MYIHISVLAAIHSPDSIGKSKLWHLVTYWFRLHMKRGQYTWQKAVQELWQLLVNFMDLTRILVFYQWPTKIVMSRQFSCTLEIFCCDVMTWSEEGNRLLWKIGVWLTCLYQPDRSIGSVRYKKKTAKYVTTFRIFCVSCHGLNSLHHWVIRYHGMVELSELYLRQIHSMWGFLYLW